MNLSKRRWLFQYCVSILLIFPAGLYLLAHYALNLSVSQLLEPVALITAIAVLAGPLLYWARERALGETRDFRAIYVVAGAFGLGFCLLSAYYAVRLGRLSPRSARELSLVAAISIPFWVFLVYHLRRKLRRVP